MDLNSRFNYYDILEINPHCPQHEITSAYERAKTTYSGENPAIYTMFSEGEARDLLRLIEEAYSVLGNKTLRALYDERIRQKRPAVDLSFESLQTESRVTFSSGSKKTVSGKSTYEVDETLEKEIREVSTWNGALLKKIREYKKISLEGMSEKTKVSIYYIRAIEDGDPKNLPAPVFVRGYVAQIAKTLSLPEKNVADSYMKHFKELLENK